MKRLFVLLSVLIVWGVPTVSLAFTDVMQNHKFYKEITWLAENNVVGGYSDGTFKPNKTVNRAELLKIVYGALGLEKELYEAIGFSDVKVNDWFAPYIYVAKKRGSVQGYKDGTFKPGNPVKRGEAFKIILNEFYLNAIEVPQGKSEVSDATPSDWFFKYAQFGAAKDLFDGSKFNAKAEMTRGDVAQLVYRVKTLKDNPKKESYSSSIKPKALSTTIPMEELLKKIEAVLPDATPVNITQVRSHAYFFSYNSKLKGKTFGWYRMPLTGNKPKAELIFGSDSFSTIDRGAVSSDGKEFLMALDDGTLAVLDETSSAKTKTVLGTFAKDREARYRAVTYSPDNKYIILFDEIDSGLLVVDAKKKDLKNGTFVAGFALPGIGGGGFEAGFNYYPFVFLDANRVQFMFDAILNLSTMKRE